MFQKPAPKRARFRRKKPAEAKYKSPFDAAKAAAALKRQNTEEKKGSDEDDDEEVETEMVSSRTDRNLIPVTIIPSSHSQSSIPALLQWPNTRSDMDDDQHNQEEAEAGEETDEEESDHNDDDDIVHIHSHNLSHSRSRSRGNGRRGCPVLLEDIDIDEDMSDLTQSRHHGYHRHRNTTALTRGRGGLTGSLDTTADDITRDGLGTALSFSSLSILNDLSQSSMTHNTNNNNRSRSRSGSGSAISVTAIGTGSSSIGTSQCGSSSGTIGCLSRADHVLNGSEEISGSLQSQPPSWLKRSDSLMSISQSGYLTPSSQSAHFLNDDEMRAQLIEDRRIANVAAAEARFQCHPRLLRHTDTPHHHHHDDDGVSPPTSSLRRLDCSSGHKYGGANHPTGSVDSTAGAGEYSYHRRSPTDIRWPESRADTSGCMRSGGTRGTSVASVVSSESMVYDDCYHNEFALDHSSLADGPSGCCSSSSTARRMRGDSDNVSADTSMLAKRKRAKRKRRSTISHGTGRIAREYEFITELGEGSFGKVGRYRRRSDGIEYAIKKVSSGRYSSITEAVIEQVKREGMVLAGLQTHGCCAHIVRYLDMWFDSYLSDIYKVFDFYLVCEYCSLGSLDPHRQLFHSDHTLATILLHISRALKFIHKAGVVHLDVKPENILISRVSNDYHPSCSSSSSSSSSSMMFGSGAGDSITGTSSSSSLSSSSSMLNHQSREVFKLADFGLALKLPHPYKESGGCAGFHSDAVDSAGCVSGFSMVSGVSSSVDDTTAVTGVAGCSGASGFLSSSDDHSSNHSMNSNSNGSINMDHHQSRTVRSQKCGMRSSSSIRNSKSMNHTKKNMSKSKMSSKSSVTFQIDEGDKRYLSLELLEGRVSREDNSLYMCDMFALGATVYEMMIGKELPGEGMEYGDLRRGIFDSLPAKYERVLPDSMAGQVLSFVRALMRCEPSLRPSAAQIVDKLSFIEDSLLREKDAELLRCQQELMLRNQQLKQLKQQQQFFDAKARSTSPTISFGW